MKTFFTYALLLVISCPRHAEAKTGEALFGKKNVKSPSIQEANAMLGKQELCFVANNGQIKDQKGRIRKDVDYKLSGQGMNLFVGSGGMHYQFYKPAQNKGGKAEVYRMDVELKGADRHVKGIAEEGIGYYENYWMGGHNVITAHACRRIRYKSVYPGIDWVLYIKDGAVEYDFVLQAGADVSKIKLRYKGAVELAIDEAGRLNAATPLGSIAEQAPYAYDSEGQKVKAAFALKGNELSFRTGAYKGCLTIDPILKWATYYGGFVYELCYAVTCDTGTSIYMTGHTNSAAGIATAGAYQTSLSGGGFLVKFDSAGNRLWGTYYGGTDGNGIDCKEICADPFGNIYVSGQTSITMGLSTPGCHQPAYGGNDDVSLTKFNMAGYPVWCTYYGGNGGEESGGVSCDNQGNVYLAGETASANNIASPGAYKTSINLGFTSAFLAKFDSAGVRQWGTYYGGSANDEINDICYDRDQGGMYVCGSTASADSIATAGTYQTSYGGGTLDGFIAKFDDNGNLLWGSYYGGSGTDSAAYIGGNEGLIYICGRTGSSSGIASAGSYQTTYGGGVADGFLARFSPTGQRLWGTYYGGSEQDLVTGLALSTASNNIFIAGRTRSEANIATPGSHQEIYGAGVNDAFLAKFQDLGNACALVWATYYGGTDMEINAVVAADRWDNVYLAGGTFSVNAIATPGAFKTSIFPGEMDAFLARFRNCDPPEQPDTIIGDMHVCAGQPQTYTATVAAGATSYVWVLPPGWTGSSSSNSITITPNDTAGTITVIAINGCDGSAATNLNVNIYLPFEPPISNNAGLLSTNSYSSYQWYKDGLPINGATGQTYSSTLSGQYYVHVTDANGCAGNSDTIWVWAVNVANVANAAMWINVWPNPAKESFALRAVSGRAGAYVVSLCDVVGRELVRDDWDGVSEKQIDMEGLASGVYLLQVYDASTGLKCEKKIVKQ